jgi:hypothetical protein
MTMKRALSAVLLLLAGCGSEPGLSRLKTGTEALTYHRTERHVPLRGLPEGRGVAGMTLDFLPLGTKVRVIEDTEKDPDLEGHEGERDVAVVPLEGEYKGVAGKIARKDLRPIAR